MMLSTHNGCVNRVPLVKVPLYCFQGAPIVLLTTYEYVQDEEG